MVEHWKPPRRSSKESCGSVGDHETVRKSSKGSSRHASQERSHGSGSRSSSKAKGAVGEARDRSMVGRWRTPFCTDFIDNPVTGGFISPGGGDDAWSIEVDWGELPKLRMSREGSSEVVQGVANFSFTEIVWDCGAVWRKVTPPLSPEDLVRRENCLLSAWQEAIVVERLNESIDIPLVSAEWEKRKIFEPIVEKAQPLVGEAIKDVVSEKLFQLIITAIDDRVTVPEKRLKTRVLFNETIQEPVVKHIHGKVDLLAVPDYLEYVVLNKVVTAITEQAMNSFASRFSRIALA